MSRGRDRDGGDAGLGLNLVGRWPGPNRGERVSVDPAAVGCRSSLSRDEIDIVHLGPNG